MNMIKGMVSRVKGQCMKAGIFNHKEHKLSSHIKCITPIFICIFTLFSKDINVFHIILTFCSVHQFLELILWQGTWPTLFLFRNMALYAPAPES